MSDKTEEKFSYQKSLSALFASISVLCFGALSLLNNFTMDLYAVLFMFSIVLPASLSMGFMGFVIGRIFDQNANFANITSKGQVKPLQENPYKIKSMFSDDTVSVSDNEPLEENESV